MEIQIIFLFLVELYIILNKQIMDPKKPFMVKQYEIVSSNGFPCNLGFGAYGSVQLGRSVKTKETVAIKRIGRKIASGEVQVHMKLHHPNIIRMIDYYFDQKHECTYIILQYAENGTLFDYIRDHGLKDKRMIRGIFMSVCDAINYMHSMDIMHRDIKPENILLDHKNSVKVCDFGFAAHCQPRMTLCGTVQYMAPQMILRKPYNHKIDIWGLGILLFQMIQGKAPFEGQNQQQVLEKMKKSIYFSKNFTADQIQLVHKILKVNPNERPEIKQIMKSPCLRNSSHRGSEESSKRSTLEENKSITTNDQIEKRPTFEEQKKIKIVEIIDLHPEKVQKNEKAQKIQKKSFEGIKIVHVKDYEEPEKAHMGGSKMLPQKIERNTNPGSSGSIPPPPGLHGKDSKISLKKQNRNS